MLKFNGLHLFHTDLPRKSFKSSPYIAWIIKYLLNNKISFYLNLPVKLQIHFSGEPPRILHWTLLHFWKFFDFLYRMYISLYYFVDVINFFRFNSVLTSFCQNTKEFLKKDQKRLPGTWTKDVSYFPFITFSAERLW